MIITVTRTIFGTVRCIVVYVLGDQNTISLLHLIIAQWHSQGIRGMRQNLGNIILFPTKIFIKRLHRARNVPRCVSVKDPDTPCDPQQQPWLRLYDGIMLTGGQCISMVVLRLHLFKDLNMWYIAFFEPQKVEKSRSRLFHTLEKVEISPFSHLAKNVEILTFSRCEKVNISIFYFSVGWKSQHYIECC